MTLQVYHNQLQFYDDDNNYIDSIGFYQKSINGKIGVVFLYFNHTRVCPIDQLLDVIEEPYRTCLLFNLDLLEEVNRNVRTW